MREVRNNRTVRWYTLALAAAAVATLGLTPSAFAQNSLQVVSPGLNSTNYTLQVDLQPGATNNVYVQSDHPSAETHYRIRFWLDPSGLDLPPNTAVRIGAIGSLSSDPSINGQKIVLFLRHDHPNPTTDTYQLNAWGKEDGANYRFLTGVWAGYVATPSARQFEVEWTRSTGPSSGDGVYRVARLGTGGGEQILSNLQMYDFSVDYIRLGAIASTGGRVSTASYYQLDEFESYR